MTKRPKLHPNHRHQWADDLLNSPMLRCTICDLQAPRWLVRPDQPHHVPVTDNGVTT